MRLRMNYPATSSGKSNQFLLQQSPSREAHARQLKGKSITNKTPKPFTLSRSKRERHVSSFDKLRTNGQTCGKSLKLTPIREAGLKNDRIWTIPNLLTVMRLLILIPVFICLSRGERYRVFFWGLLAVGTDFLDGLAARWLNQFSELGRILDPIIDKIGVLSVLTFLVISPRYDFPLWFFSFLLIREAAVLVCGFFILKKNARVTESNKAGKWSAFTTGSAVLLYILNWQPFGKILLWIAFILNIYSSYTYLQVFLLKSKSA